MYFLGLVFLCAVAALVLSKPVGRWYDRASGPAQRWFIGLSFLASIGLFASVFYVTTSPNYDVLVVLADLVPIPLALVAYHRSRRIKRIGMTKEFRKVLRAKKKQQVVPQAPPAISIEEKIEAVLRGNRR